MFLDVDSNEESNDNDSEYQPSEQDSSDNEEFPQKNESVSNKTISSSSFDISQLNMVGSPHVMMKQCMFKNPK